MLQDCCACWPLTSIRRSIYRLKGQCHKIFVPVDPLRVLEEAFGFCRLKGQCHKIFVCARRPPSSTRRSTGLRRAGRVGTTSRGRGGARAAQSGRSGRRGYSSCPDTPTTTHHISTPGYRRKSYCIVKSLKSDFKAKFAIFRDTNKNTFAAKIHT